MAKKYLKLDEKKFAIACGLVSAIFIVFTTLFAMLNYFQLWALLIQDIYGFFGYSISFKGVILGSIYGFIDGFVFAYLFAWIYNKL